MEEEIYPTIISGTSGGALVGGLYANSLSPEDMLRFFKEIPLFNFSFFAFGKPGVVDSSKYIKPFESHLPKKTFEELDRTLIVAGTNIISGKVTYFDKGDLIKPLIASSALPPYFSPIEIEGNIYVDGGVLDNFPLKAIKDRCDLVIGSFVNPLKKITKKEINTTLKLLTRVYNVGMDASYYEKFKMCNYMFIPEGIEGIGVLDSKMIEKAYKIGYNQALKNMQEIKKSLQLN